MNPKIQEHHRSKPAYIYLRQSTPGQVLHHRESTERQYALREKARELGWSESLIRTLDQDLGKTGTEMTRREDFKTLVVRFINTLTYFGLCGRRFGRSKLVHEFGQILTRELPFEGTRGCFPVVLKIEQSFGEGFQVFEVVGFRTLRGTMEKEIST